MATNATRRTITKKTGLDKRLVTYSSFFTSRRSGTATRRPAASMECRARLMPVQFIPRVDAGSRVHPCERRPGCETARRHRRSRVYARDKLKHPERYTHRL